MAFLSIQHASKNYGSAVAVEDFNLEIEKGELVSFLGPSGCGKTTTLRMVAGFEVPSSGKIELSGVDITSRPPNQRNVGMVFQAYALFPNMTVADNVGFGLKVANKPTADIRRRTDEMLTLIRMPQLGDRYPYQLSGGQQQRVALARALAIQPSVLLLDEPLSALDAKIRVELRSEIRRIQQQLGITTIYVTHDQEEALSISDRIVVMSAGRMEQVGTPFEIYNFPKTAFAASFVGTLNQLRCTVVDADQAKLAFDGQTFTAAAPIRAAKGASVVAALRPEELHIGRFDGENQLTGTVEAVTFLGGIVRIRLALGESRITLDALNERRLTLPKVGETQTVSFPPHACWVMVES
ncbi:MAG TPA: ABC transporter ATP-binding protein [Anaerolineales bacterium]|nr:ABC transporter ATP-binding protein [Anaerolineales bacterium]